MSTPSKSELREEYDRLELRQLALRSIMQSSDAHACQCTKLNNDFQEQYPEEAAEYVTARSEFHENEDRMIEIQELLNSSEEE